MRFELAGVPEGGLDVELLVAVVGLLLVLGAAGLRLLPGERGPSAACAFKVVTGRPCPSCGGTRAARSLAHLEFGEALRWNPLVAACLMFAGPYGAWVVAARIFNLRRVRLRLAGRKERWMLAAAVLGILLANWAYLVAAGV